MSGDNLIRDIISPIRGAMNIIPVDGPDTFQALITDDLLDCEGTLTVIFPTILIAVKRLWVFSGSGTVTVTADATIEGTTILTTGMGIMFYPSRGKWRQ